jgi:peptidoglycan-associated lipoprotein
MRKLTEVLAVLALMFGFFVLTCSPAAAQSIEVGANYNYVHTNAPPGGCGCFALNGGSAWVGVNLTRSFGIVGEVASQHGSDSTGDLMLTSYLAGPRYTVHGFDRFKPFAQVLFGGAHASGSLAPGSASISGSPNAFAMTGGGGLDIGLTEHILLRAIQADYYLTHFDNGVNTRQNNFRIGAGLVIHFGSH